MMQMLLHQWVTLAVRRKAVPPATDNQSAGHAVGWGWHGVRRIDRWPIVRPDGRREGGGEPPAPSWSMSAPPLICVALQMNNSPYMDYYSSWGVLFFIAGIFLHEVGNGAQVGQSSFYVGGLGLSSRVFAAWGEGRLPACE
jgi:hypothetical protein